MSEANTVESEAHREMEEAQAVEGEGSGRPVRENASQENSGEPNNAANDALYQTLRQITATLTGMQGRLSELEQQRSVTSVERAVEVVSTQSAPLDNISPGSTPSPTISVDQSIPRTPINQTVVIRPRDIKVLELEALQRLDSAARLQMFFEAVEGCTDDPKARLAVAKTRVDGDLAVMIHTTQGQGDIKSWNDLKKFLSTEFNLDMNFDQAWRQNDTFYYNWMGSPQSFVQQFKCHYAAIKGCFQSEQLPDRDRLLKRKLLQGFPRNSRDSLEAFMDDNIPLNKFVAHVENERLLLLNRPSVNTIPVKSRPEGLPNQARQESPSLSVNPSSVPTSACESGDSLAALNAKLQQLQQQISQLNSANIPYQVREYCAFCRSTSHSLPSCWRKPPRNHCFDCRREGCRRGHSSCPGISSAPSVAQPERR